MNASSLSFQDIILRLQQYWGEQGCVIMQPYDSEVGAGTFHTATTLRSLGPAEWRTCYAQPCRRPADGRYGENPNRMQHYYQFQVLIKPSPVNAQELYLGSLAAIGLDPNDHDVRFVEDDWESPTLGAWGLGWEVWLNGMEVTQFTYFQQVGGIVFLQLFFQLVLFQRGKASVFCRILVYIRYPAQAEGCCRLGLLTADFLRHSNQVVVRQNPALHNAIRAHAEPPLPLCAFHGDVHTAFFAAGTFQFANRLVKKDFFALPHIQPGVTLQNDF